MAERIEMRAASLMLMSTRFESCALVLTVTICYRSLQNFNRSSANERGGGDEQHGERVACTASSSSREGPTCTVNSG